MLRREIQQKFNNFVVKCFPPTPNEVEETAKLPPTPYRVEGPVKHVPPYYGVEEIANVAAQNSAKIK